MKTINSNSQRPSDSAGAVQRFCAPGFGRNLDTRTTPGEDLPMKSAIQLSRQVILTLVIVTQLALACGDPSATATPGAKAQLIIGGSDGHVRVGEPVYANLILPKGSELLTGTLSRGGCTALEFKVEPSTGWHDPW